MTSEDLELNNNNNNNGDHESNKSSSKPTWNTIIGDEDVKRTEINKKEASRVV